MIYLSYCIYGLPADMVHETVYVGTDVIEATKAACLTDKAKEGGFKSFVQTWGDGKLAGEKVIL